MTLPYYTVPFKFSQEALDYIKEHTAPMVEDFQKNSKPYAGLVTLEQEDVIKWENSIVWKELLEFVAKYNLPTPDLQFFIYKKMVHPLPDPRGNPHIDTTVPEGSDKGIDGAKRDVPARFNILVDGDDDQEMVWWEIDRTNPVIKEVMFMRPNGREAARLQVNGNTSAERWDNLKEPKWKYNRLTKINEYASFVKTDILHAINWDGRVPRLILSLRFLERYEEIINRVKAV